MTDYARVKDWREKQPNIKEIRAAEARRWRAAHPDVAARIKAAYRERSKEKRLPREAEQARERRKRDPEGELRRRLAFEARKEAKRVAVAGRPRASKCEVCEESGKTVFDHCHASGNFRGWICDRCNKVLGLVKDNPSVLRGLADYLEDHNVEADN